MTLREVGSLAVAWTPKLPDGQGRAGQGMVELSKVKIGKSGLLGLAGVKAIGPNTRIHDAGPGSVSGFQLRRQTGATASFVVRYRFEGRQFEYVIGKAGSPWTPDTARKEARRVLALVSRGINPAAEKRAEREAATMAELCDTYVAAAEAGTLLKSRGTAKGKPKKSSTIATDRGRIEAHIKPLIGHFRVKSVTPKQCQDFMDGVRKGKTARRRPTGNLRGMSIVRGGDGAATRTMALLSAIFSFAMREGHRSDNPAREVVRPAYNARDRRLSDEEYAALGMGLAEVWAQSHDAGGKPVSRGWPPAMAAARFLALTGWRRGEVLNLRWRDINMTTRTAWLPDTKTGSSMRPLPHAASDVLRSLPGGKPTAFVFPSEKSGSAMNGFSKTFKSFTLGANLPQDITPHVLRHSFASVAGDIGLSLPTIGALMGHKSGGVTSKYIHHADAVLLSAADQVANSIMQRMGEPAPAPKVEPPSLPG